MTDSLKIFRNSLILDQDQMLDITVAPDFLDVDEPHLSFDDPVHIQGICQLKQEGIFFHLHIQTKASMTCTICNEWTKYVLDLKNVQHFEKNTHCCDNEFDFSNIVRENILLETPKFVECNGKCEERNEMKKYLK